MFEMSQVSDVFQGAPLAPLDNRAVSEGDLMLGLRVEARVREVLARDGLSAYGD